MYGNDVASWFASRKPKKEIVMCPPRGCIKTQEVVPMQQALPSTREGGAKGGVQTFTADDSTIKPAYSNNGESNVNVGVSASLAMPITTAIGEVVVSESIDKFVDGPPMLGIGLAKMSGQLSYGVRVMTDTFTSRSGGGCPSTFRKEAQKTDATPLSDNVKGKASDRFFYGAEIAWRQPLFAGVALKQGISAGLMNGDFQVLGTLGLEFLVDSRK